MSLAHLSFPLVLGLLERRRAQRLTLPLGNITMRTPMSARVAPMEQAPAPAMLVPLDAPGDQRLALGLDLRADEVRCVALRHDGCHRYELYQAATVVVADECFFLLLPGCAHCAIDACMRRWLVLARAHASGL